MLQFRNNLETKRLLKREEIEDVVEFVKPLPFIPEEIANCIQEAQKEKFRLMIKNKEIYPTKIKDLKHILRYQYEKSFLQAGKMVGIQTASSIGEKNTQQTLNAFHTAGSNKVELTSGIPRLEELLNCNRDVKTPSMDVFFDLIVPGINEPTKDFNFMRRFIYDKFECKTIYQLLLDYDYKENRELTIEEERWYQLHSEFVGDEYLECKYSIRLVFDCTKLYQYRKSLRQIGDVIHNTYIDAIPIPGPDNTGILDIYIITEKLGEVQDIIDSVKASRRKNKKERVHMRNKRIKYKDIKDAKIEKNKKEENEEDNEDENEEDEEQNDEDENEEEKIIREKKEKISTDHLNFLINEDNKEKFFVRDLVLPSILYMNISGIEGITQIYFQETKDKEWYISTKGANYKKIMGLEYVNKKKTTSNNMWDIYDLHGIEAAKSFLSKEFYQIIGIGGRHITLLIDAMTYSGKIQPVNRYGIDRKSSGIMAKIGFEQAFDNFFIAGTFHEEERADSIASTVILGLLPTSGCGGVKIFDKNLKEIDDDDITDKYTEQIRLDYEKQDLLKQHNNNNNGSFTKIVNPSTFNSKQHSSSKEEKYVNKEIKQLNKVSFSKISVSKDPIRNKIEKLTDQLNKNKIEIEEEDTGIY
jgi:hypothetical protein